MSDEPFLSRWSRKKAQTAIPVSEPRPAAEPTPGQAGMPSATAPQPPVPLPPVESLTPESDFAPFLAKGVDERLKRQALKTLFQDPRFNVMDGLDVYIDDYSKPDPLPEGWLEKLNQVARLGEYREPESPDETAGKASEVEATAGEAVSEIPGEGDIAGPPPEDGFTPPKPV